MALRISKLSVRLLVLCLSFLFSLSLILPPETFADCDPRDEKYPLRPYAGEPCREEVPKPNTIACADRPLPVGERTYTVTCPGGIGTSCIYTAPPTTFVGRFAVTLNRFTETPFTGFAEYTRPDYSPSFRNLKRIYLSDYLGGSGSVFYDTQPLTSTDRPVPTPHELLDNSAVWQRLTPKKLQDEQKKSLQSRVGQDVHDYVALYGSPDSPSPRESLSGSPTRISSVAPDSPAWKYVPAFSLEDSPGFVYLNFDTTTNREKIYVPHLPRIGEATLKIQQTLSPDKLNKITLPQPPAQDDPMPQDDPPNTNDPENPGIDNLIKFHCDLEVTGYSPSDYLYADHDPAVDVVTWTEIRPERLTSATELPHGSSFTVVSEYPGTPDPESKIRYFLSRIPFLKPIWTGLYNASNAVFRTILPKSPGSVTFWPGVDAVGLDWPAEGTSPYSFTDTKAKAGKDKPGEEAKFYYRFLFILNRAAEDVIKSTNPHKLASSYPAPSPGRPLPPGAPYCGAANAPPALVSALREASSRFNTPMCVLTAVAKIEGSHLFSATDTDIQSWLAPGGIDPNNCNPNPWGAAGPMQFVAGPWYNWPHADGIRGYGAALSTSDPAYADPATPPHASRCNLRAALWGASKKLSSDSINAPGPGNGYISGPINPSSSWTEDMMRSAALHYYGSCVNDPITRRSLGMSYCDFVVKECETGNACAAPTPAP